MKIDLQGKVALVTGGGAGIGKGIVDAFAELGATLVVAEIEEAKCKALREELGDDALVAQIDVRDAAQVAALPEQIAERFGRLDVLVNNVGHHLGIFNSFEDSTEAEWEGLYDINLKHMFIVSRAMIPLMKHSAGVNGGGSIINISSIEGFRGYPGSVAYTTFKHAVTGFTRALAMQLAGDQIRVNLIGPETTETEQVQVQGRVRPEYWEAANRTIPLGRYGRPSDHAGAAVFLATELSAWVTGMCMIIDGGGLTAGGFQRTPDGKWTIMPVVSDRAY
ncbi:MAG TPA: SDR family NAD(P)-dependent oxidoreductase [Jatrophihabitans sp.]|jgi:NAD(P)-dependent dehydrogenase (short-subunit alcohol dehydrogenase family)